jgi:hypothetical protein
MYQVPVDKQMSLLLKFKLYKHDQIFLPILQVKVRLANGRLL